MRYAVIFILLASVVMAFIFADQFPQFLAHYPRLQEANWTVRSWLGMKNPRGPRRLERELKETGRILQQTSPVTKQITEQDLEEYQE